MSGGHGPALRDWVDGRREAMLADLAEYVGRETSSDDKPALDATLTWLEGWLAERLGAPEAARRVDGGPYGDTLVHHYPGQGDRPILLLCHYDTVWPPGTLVERPFQVDGDRMTGPGVFDMKAGLVQAVYALLALDAAGLPRPPVRLLLNGDEEIGSLASREVIEQEAAGAAAALVFESAADGALKTARKGIGIFDIEVRGVEAHAGLDPSRGVSAIDELARVVLALHALTDPAAGTTVNVGVVEGGTRTNVTAGRARAAIDVRIARQSEAARIDAALAALAPHDERAAITVGGEWNRPAMERGEGTAALFGLARELAVELGVDLRECSVGGASDGNLAAQFGLPVLDGLGPVGDGAHARHEFALVSGMVERTALAALLLRALAEGAGR